MLSVSDSRSAVVRYYVIVTGTYGHPRHTYCKYITLVRLGLGLGAGGRGGEVACASGPADLGWFRLGSVTSPDLPASQAIR